MESSSGPIPILSTDDLDPDDARSQEIVTVSYIFPELTLLSPHSFYISVPVSPVLPIPVIFSDDLTSTTSTVARTFSHFPPLQLTISLSENYPLESPPSIKLESPWLANDVITRLQQELAGLWEDIRDQVLYAVIDHLIQAAEVAFVQDKEAVSLVLPKILEEQLVTFNKKASKEVFDRGTYECGVCLGKSLQSECCRIFDST